MMRFAFLLTLLGLGVAQARAQSTPTVPPTEKASPNAQESSPDQAAIQALVVEFTRAFNEGNAKAVAQLFTDEARITSEGGETVNGRPAIEKLFADRFETDPGQTIVVKTESLRMLGSEAAIEEGTAAITIPREGENPEPETEYSQYSAAYVKQNGKWLQDCIHDFPAAETNTEKSAREHLKELEWLTGEWVDESDDGEVHTSCDWSEDHSFLLRRYKLKILGKFVMSGVQRIGWDPRVKQFRSWVFDSEGGFSDGLWSRDGDRWIIKTTGVLKDGRSASATNVVTRINHDSFRWASVDRVLGDSVLPDGEEVVLVRKPPQPRSLTSKTNEAPHATRTPQ